MKQKSTKKKKKTTKQTPILIYRFQHLLDTVYFWLLCHLRLDQKLIAA
jgi:hypothetical protein